MITTASPPFLLGTMGSGIRADLAITIPMLAGIISFGYLVASAASPFGGRLTHRIGPPSSLRLAGGLTSLGAALTASATSTLQLCAAFFAIGLANAVIQPASNGTLAGASTGRSQGLLFGMVQSAIPAATLLAGLLLAALDGADSWRRAFWTLFALSLLPQLLITRRRWRGSYCSATLLARSKEPSRSVVVLLVSGACLGSAAATTVAVFGVAGGLASGLSPITAAAGQVLGSLCCILGRVTCAWRWGQQPPTELLRRTAQLQVLGAAGLGLLAVGQTPSYLVGFAVAFGCGWGWTGLLHLALARAWPATIARVTGVMQSGLFAGSVVGPVLLGGVIDGLGYPAAWGVAAFVLSLGAAATAGAARRLRQEGSLH
jgi:hypothetical protein